MQAAAIVLAAGEGTRMRSQVPKVAHQILGVPLVRYVVDAARAAGVDRVITVIGHGAGTVASLVADTETVEQDRQLGTGHAVTCAEGALGDLDGAVLVLAGDVPLIRAETLAEMLATREKTDAACVMLTARFADPTGYGRIIRDERLGSVTGIVEQKDLAPEQMDIDECNAGIYCFDAAALFPALKQLTPQNAQGEYYLTDVIGAFSAQGMLVEAIVLDDPEESHGINTRVQLAEAARLMQRRINERHMLAGITMTDPGLVWIGPDVRIERDVVLEPMTALMGATTVGEGALVGPGTRVLDSEIGPGATVEQSVVRGARVGARALVGPNAFLRPGAVLAPDSKVGSFVEVKNSAIGENSKVPHLSYIGDATIGRDVNVGAGSITCNFDGRRKHRTTIGDGAFIGSDTMLVAPITIGERAATGAGSAITKDVPDDALGIERADQRNVLKWTVRRRSDSE